MEEDAAAMLRFTQERMGKKLKVDLTNDTIITSAQSVATQELVPAIDNLDEEVSSAPPTFRSKLLILTSVVQIKAKILLVMF